MEQQNSAKRKKKITHESSPYLRREAVRKLALTRRIRVLLAPNGLKICELNSSFCLANVIYWRVEWAVHWTNTGNSGVAFPDP